MDRHQNSIVCSLACCRPSLKISCKPFQKFLHKVANRQTKTNNDDYNILLGGGNHVAKLVDATSSEGLLVMVALCNRADHYYGRPM